MRVQEQSRQEAKRRVAVVNHGFADRPCLQYGLKCLVVIMEGGGGKVDTNGTRCTAHAAPIVFEVAPLVKRRSDRE